MGPAALSRVRRRRPWRPCLGLLVSFLLASLATFDARGQSASADEYEIRAAMLFNLTRFIDWPAAKLDQGNRQFQICVLGSDPIGVDLDVLLRNKSVGTRPVAIRHLKSADGADDCQILYVGAAERADFARASTALARNGVLTISERSNADSPGQMIGLPVVEERVRIEVNLGLVQRSGLTISSKLLHLATVSQ